MTLLHSATDLHATGKGVCLAIGFFDGVHLGHQQVIRQAVADAERQEGTAVALTFDRHPNAVVAPARTPDLIYSLPQKLRAIAATEVPATLLLQFDEAFSRQTGELFIRGLHRDFGRIQSICVGADFKFGHRRSGNVDLLRDWGKELGFSVHALAAVSLDGQAISSTRIREAVRSGQLDEAGQMLGRPYSLAGTVIPGDQLGRQLGFPTANLDVQGRVLPPSGVYAVHARIDDAPSQRAVLNIGSRPTIDQAHPEMRAEVHLLEPTGDLYGKEIEIAFVQRLRGEIRFPSLEALKKQIAQDIAQAQRGFSDPNLSNF